MNDEGHNLLRRGSHYCRFCWGLFTLGIKISQHTHFLMWPNVCVFQKFQNLRKPSKMPVCLGGASRFCRIFFKQREPHLVLCSCVTQKSKDKNKKEREISPLHADVFPAYIKSRTGEICSSPTQISQYFTAFSCQLTILSSARRSRHAAILAIYKAPTSDPWKSVS